MEVVSLEVLSVFASLFIHRWGQYALQQRDGSYRRVAEPVTLDLVGGHLAGRWTLGTYLLDGESTCRFAVFDADDAAGLVRLAGLAAQLLQQGIPSVLEASRRGGHLWVHFVEPVPGVVVRAWLLPYALALGVEFYPKQDTVVSGGSGSLVRLPLGVHRRVRGWYPFVQVMSTGELLPVGATVAECCTWVCESVQRVVVPVEVWKRLPGAESVCVSGGSGDREDGHGLVAPVSFQRSGPGSIREWCRSQDIRAVIGRYVALDGRGIGSCPFKEHHYRGDVRSSFQVFGGDDPHWYCYTWKRAGDLLDFLCLYYGLSPQEAWARVQQGALM